LRTKTNTVTGATTEYVYDVLGNLLSVSLADGRYLEYLVDAMGRRVGKKVDGVLVQQWLYRDALKPIAELDGTGHLVKQFFYGTSGIVPEFMTIGTSIYRIISDQLGSPRMVMDIIRGSAARYECRICAVRICGRVA
jgi:YD repeat-containing protein